MGCSFLKNKNLNDKHNFIKIINNNFWWFSKILNFFMYFFLVDPKVRKDLKPTIIKIIPGQFKIIFHQKRLKLLFFLIGDFALTTTPSKHTHPVYVWTLIIYWSPSYSLLNFLFPTEFSFAFPFLVHKKCPSLWFRGESPELYIVNILRRRFIYISRGEHNVYYTYSSFGLPKSIRKWD